MKTSLLPQALRGALLVGLTASATLAQESTDRSLLFDQDDPRALTNERVREQRVVHPITAPNFSDDPYITSDLRGTYINHQFPRNPFLNGGAARVYDFQGRYAVNEDLQVMVSKLGAADVHLPGSEEYGMTDLALGIKYALLADWENRQHFAIGAGYELGIGDEDVLGDDDELRVFGTFARGVGALNLSGSANLRFAMGSEDAAGDSDVLSIHLHADTEIDEHFSPVVELNYYKVLSDGDNVTPYSGVDLANFGGNQDEDVLTVGLGGEARVVEGVALRLAYETPLTDNEDLFGYRWTASAIWRF